MKTINLGPKNIIQPIEWKQYEGETIVVKTIIRKGQRIQETAFYPDKVKAVPRGNAYIIGNGPSRKDFDLNRVIQFFLFNIENVVLELGLKIKKSGKPSFFLELSVALKFVWNIFVLCLLILIPFLLLTLMIKNIDTIMSLV